MTDCRSAEPLLTPYLDGEVEDSDAVRLERHFDECAACRRRVAEERAARQMLRARRHLLAERAPLELRARCARMIPGAGAPRVAMAAPRWRRAPLAAAAGLVLVIAGAATLAGGSTPVLAAGLALDHLKCFTLFEPASPPRSAAAIAGDLHAAYGWRITVPPDSPSDRLRLVGGRRCFSTDGRVAHILYRHDGRPVSLFVVPGSDRAPGQMALAGYEAVVWSQDHVTYVVVSGERREELARVTAYLRAALGSVEDGR